MRLIDADKLKEMGATCFARRNENGKLEAIISLDNAPTVIYCSETPEGLPLMDLRPRPKGEWRKRSNGNFRCTNCEQYSSFDFPFCPNCGADMGGGGDK